MISIVMPVYNTGIFLEESLDSIIEQTYFEIEIIIIDDASDDILTRRILEKYRKKDTRIRIIRLESNVGAGEARNIGFRYSSGEYVIFLDSDDIFDKEMLQNMLESMLKYNADVCLCGHRNYNMDKGFQDYPLKRLKDVDNVFSLNQLPEDALEYWYEVPWNKLVKSELLLKNRISFQKLKSENDCFFAYMCIITANRIVYASEGRALLTYRSGHERQLSNLKNIYNLHIYMSEIVRQRLFVASTHEINQISYIYIRGVFEHLRNRIYPENEKKIFYNEVREFIKEYLYPCKKADGNIHFIMDYIIKYAYETRWFEMEGDYFRQLELANELWNRIKKYSGNEIIVWGYGKRGEATVHCLEEKSVCDFLIVDKEWKNINKRNDLDYFIENPNGIDFNGKCVLATTNDIYSRCKDKMSLICGDIINIETFCCI
ncbi:Glycosyltransferase involved in cell wall bisynthesis [Lachnospiraceae bacterium KH1T2]|nr:Glycosyltransferase involved in cell wall bisynthesis [Lachnospiraceae bacterium KH1T2]